ncbi:MAG: hypothetical protein ABIL69_00365 [candidate division WOR-3 bacterium]
MNNIPKSGLFIVLYDIDTLKLYLQKRIYGFLMPPVFGPIVPKGIRNLKEQSKDGWRNNER